MPGDLAIASSICQIGKSALLSAEQCVSGYLHNLIVNVHFVCPERETAQPARQYGARLLTAAVEALVSHIYLCKLFMRNVTHLCAFAN